MLRKMGELKGFAIGARDGDSGEAKFYFRRQELDRSLFGRRYESLAAGAQGPYFTHRRRSRRLGRKETPCSADSGTGKKQSRYQYGRNSLGAR